MRVQCTQLHKWCVNRAILINFLVPSPLPCILSLDGQFSYPSTWWQLLTQWRGRQRGGRRWELSSATNSPPHWCRDPRKGRGSWYLGPEEKNSKRVYLYSRHSPWVQLTCPYIIDILRVWGCNRESPKVKQIRIAYLALFPYPTDMSQRCPRGVPKVKRRKFMHIHYS